MALFIFLLFIICNSLVSVTVSENNNNAILEIKPSTITGGQNVGFYKVEDMLNLTCTFRNETVFPDVVLEWIVPTKASNSQNRVSQKTGRNYVVLIIKNLQENDSGDYKCRAVHNGIPFFNSENTVRISVKNKKKECTDVMFQCSIGICISKRYTCDGQLDCPNGEDESSIYCGPGNPCDNKLMCPENRCIPFTWCCELHREPNCTTKVKHSCCTHVEKLTRDADNDLGYQYEQQRFNDMGFLQTTVYTVIGCAMAFMFIVTIIVIAVCRVHVRRTLLSRCPTANRNIRLNRGANIHGNQLNGLSFYDLDLYFNRSGLTGNDLMSVNPLLVTYNINNGVQFVGRPIDPPPYCEIVTSPPKEGPPPPYASQEDLTIRKIEEPENHGVSDGAEVIEVCVDSGITESDALLGSTSQSISVISCNAIDANSRNDDVPSEEPTDQPDGSSGRSPDVSKDFFEPIVNINSSHSDGKNLDSKNSGLDVVLMNNCDSIVAEPLAETFKLQNGESSSYVSNGVSDISKGAVKKIVNTNSLDNSSRRKTKSFSKTHLKKF